MNTFTWIAAAGVLAASNAALAADTAPLTPQTPITIPGSAAHWDFITFDAGMHRVLACHPGAKQLVVLDTTTNTVTQIDTGEVNGCAIDEPDNKYFTDGGNQDVVVIDRATLKKVADIPVTGPADDVIYEPKNAMVYVCHDDGTEDWVIDPKTDKVIGSVTVAGAPEVLAYDSTTDKIYQTIKPTDQIQVIDPATNAVTATWSTLPAHSPHGMAIDSDKGLVFSAGKNGKLAVIDIKSGTVTGSCDIAMNVDQIAYNSDTHTIYCACGAGAISVVKVSKKGHLKAIGDVTVPKGCHSIAVDPATQNVWVSYSDTTNSYLQCFAPAKVASN